MNKLTIIFFILLTQLTACNKTIEKPPISIDQYSRQLIVMDGVINKILNETDPKKMNAMADAIESARAVSCIPIGDECNSYYKLINKTVKLTKDGTLTNDQRMELFKLQNDYQADVKKSEVKIKELWKVYIQTTSASK